MEKEFLEDYLAKEKIEIDRFLDDLLRVDSHSSYPDKSRFHKLKEPIGKGALFSSIWPQIPLFGSFIIPIIPVEEDYFHKFHGIEKRDLERFRESYRFLQRYRKSSIHIEWRSKII